MENCLLEQLAYADLTIGKDSQKSRREMHRLSDLMERHENDLKEMLGDKGKEIFEKYLDCVSEFHGINERQQFIDGVQLGGKLVIEMLYGDENKIELNN